jgi:hypothetical protein
MFVPLSDSLMDSCRSRTLLGTINKSRNDQRIEVLNNLIGAVLTQDGNAVTVHLRIDDSALIPLKDTVEAFSPIKMHGVAELDWEMKDSREQLSCDDQVFHSTEFVGK